MWPSPSHIFLFLSLSHFSSFSLDLFTAAAAQCLAAHVCSYSPPGVDALRALNETNSGVLLIVREFLVCQGFPGWSAGLYQSAPAALDRRATGNRFLDYFISNATFLLREQK